MALPAFALSGLLLAAYAAIVLALAGAVAATLPAPASAQERRTVVIAFHPGGGLPGPGRVRVETVFERLAERPALALGLLGATQGPYTRRQTLLDITAGNRVSRSGYDPQQVPRYKPRRTGSGWEISRWDEIVRRAGTAPVEIHPGLLAASVGGAAYVGATARPAFEAVVAADRRGRVDRVSMGPPSTLLERTERALGERSLVVVALPAGERGDEALDELLAARRRQQLLLVIRRPPASDTAQVLPFGAAGLPGGGLLTSRTTRRVGLVTATDAVPTVLGWLDRPVPAQVAGRPITATGERDVAKLKRLESRLRLVYPRRFPALFVVFAALAITSLALSLAGGRPGRRRALRVSALAVMWIPSASLAAAALQPTKTGELAIMGIGTVVLALATDRLLPWPRAPLAPALVGVPAYALDMAMGSDLIVTSLLGPNPRFGSRFYGIGNELEAALPVLLLLGLAGLAGRRPRSRRLAALFALSMLVLGAVLGAGRLGADVGGVITVGAGAAAAVLVLLPGGISRRAVALALAVPALALAALAAIDIATGGDAHFSRTVLGAESGGALGKTIARRYELAWQTLLRGLMPLITLLAAALAVYAWQHRHRLYAPVADRPAWMAALVGGLVGSVVGALTNDSGPVLLVVGVFVLASATAYVRGDPRLATADPPPPDEQPSQSLARGL